MDHELLILAFITGLPATLAAVAGIITSVANGKKTDKVLHEVNSNTAYLNSRIEALQGELSVSNSRVAALLEKIGVTKEEKGKVVLAP